MTNGAWRHLWRINGAAGCRQELSDLAGDGAVGARLSRRKRGRRMGDGAWRAACARHLRWRLPAAQLAISGLMVPARFGIFCLFFAGGGIFLSAHYSGGQGALLQHPAHRRLYLAERQHRHGSLRLAKPISCLRTFCGFAVWWRVAALYLLLRGADVPARSASAAAYRLTTGILPASGGPAC